MSDASPDQYPDSTKPSHERLEDKKRVDIAEYADAAQKKRYDFMRDYNEIQRLKMSGAVVKKESLFSKREWLEILGFQVAPVVIFALVMFVLG